jgi:hypothetical protein
VAEPALTTDPASIPADAVEAFKAHFVVADNPHAEAALRRALAAARPLLAGDDARRRHAVGPLTDETLDDVARALHDHECECAGATHPDPARVRRLYLSAADESLLRVAWPVFMDHWRRGTHHETVI